MLPGLNDDIYIQFYHAHNSLSHSLCKWLEPEHAPLQFYYRSWLNPHRPLDELKSECVYFGDIMHKSRENPDSVKTLKLATRKNGAPIKRTSQRGLIGIDQKRAMEVLNAKLDAMPLVQEAMAEGKPEVSLLAEYLDVPIRCRPDLLSSKLEVHWKFTGRMDLLGQTIDRFRYIEGLAWYRRVRREAGLPPVRQIMIFCETRAPYEIRTVEVSPYFIDEAETYGHRAVMRFKELYRQFGDLQWPDYRLQPQDVFTGAAGSPRHAIELPSSYDKRLAA